MEEILVAIDGSKHSDVIVDHACDLAKKLPAKILLMHVVKKEGGGSPEEFSEYARAEHDPDAFARYFQSIGEGIIEKFGARIRQRGMECETLLETGNPAERIVEEAAHRKSSAIVVGLRGLHGIDKIRTLGSVSRRVLENAHCTVVVVSV